MNEIILKHNSSKFSKDEKSLFFSLKIKELEILENSLIVPSPYFFKIPKMPNINLMEGLKLYLEDNSMVSFSIEYSRTKLILVALKEWGKILFKNLSLNKYITYSNYDQISIISNDPSVLNWPWEVLTDENDNYIASKVKIKRIIESKVDKTSFHSLDRLDKDIINVLLIIPRPKNDLPYQYQTTSGNIFQTVNQISTPINIDVLRPPSYEQLKKHLGQFQNFYHIIHFDGHGEYDFEKDENSNKNGYLLFEDKTNSKTTKIPFYKIADLLLKYPVPIVILDACQSALIDPTHMQKFASIPNIVANSYKINTTAAQEFFSIFYKVLLDNGNVLSAVHQGRLQMKKQPIRRFPGGEYEKQDWMIPVLYQNYDHTFTFANKQRISKIKSNIHLDKPSCIPENIIIRDNYFQIFEKAVLKNCSCIYLYGLLGAGKSTLIYSFFEWLLDTNGLQCEPVWFDLNSVHSISIMISCIHDKLLTIKNIDSEVDNKFNFIVIDNFDSENLSVKEYNELKSFFKQLYKTKTKIIITSRNINGWFKEDKKYVHTIYVKGFNNIEAWNYFDMIENMMKDEFDIDDKHIEQIFESVDNNPLCIKIVFSSGNFYINQYKTNFINYFNLKDTHQQQLLDNLEYTVSLIPNEMNTLLVFMSFFENYFDKIMFKRIAELINPSLFAKKSILDFLQIFIERGFINIRNDLLPDLFQIHFALTAYLSHKLHGECKELSTFKYIYNLMLSQYANEFIIKSVNKEISAQKFIEIYNLFKNSFKYALKESINDKHIQSPLIEFSALYCLKIENYDEAKNLYFTLLDIYKETKNKKGTANAYFQLSNIFESEKKFDKSIEFLQKSDLIEKTINNPIEIAKSHIQKAQVLRNTGLIDKSDENLYEALNILNKNNMYLLLPSVYTELGINAAEKQNYDKAKTYLTKSIQLIENNNTIDKTELASNLYNIGYTERLFGHYRESLNKYKQAFALFKEHGNYNDAVKVLVEMGVLSEKHNKFDDAEKYYRDALSIIDEESDPFAKACLFCNIGNVALYYKSEYSIAKEWYLKSLDFFKKIFDRKNEGRIYHHLGHIALKDNIQEAKKKFILSLNIACEEKDELFINKNEIELKLLDKLCIIETSDHTIIDTNNNQIKKNTLDSLSQLTNKLLDNE